MRSGQARATGGAVGQIAVGGASSAVSPVAAPGPGSERAVARPELLAARLARYMYIAGGGASARPRGQARATGGAVGQIAVGGASSAVSPVAAPGPGSERAVARPELLAARLARYMYIAGGGASARPRGQARATGGAVGQIAVGGASSAVSPVAAGGASARPRGQARATGGVVGPVAAGGARTKAASARWPGQSYWPRGWPGI